MFYHAGSPEEPVWREAHPAGWSTMKLAGLTTGTTEAHHAVDKQDYGLLTKVLDAHEEMVHAKDDNGWTARE